MYVPTNYLFTTDDTVDDVCLADCECPCSWVTPVNYTDEELKASIRKIQEKLKLNNDELSKEVFQHSSPVKP